MPAALRMVCWSCAGAELAGADSGGGAGAFSGAPYFIVRFFWFCRVE